MKLKFCEGQKIIPVMSREAFVAFAKEWDAYVRTKGYKPCMWFPNPNSRYATSPPEGGLYAENSGGFIARVTGYVSKPRDSVNNTHIGDRVEEISVNDITSKLEMGENFAFREIGTGVVNLDGNEDEIIEATRRMIHKRSALVRKGLFGYHIEI